jgi:hypothetical protein
LKIWLLFFEFSKPNKKKLDRKNSLIYDLLAVLLDIYFLGMESTLKGLAACRLKKREQAWQDKAP